MTPLLGLYLIGILVAIILSVLILTSKDDSVLEVMFLSVSLSIIWPVIVLAAIILIPVYFLVLLIKRIKFGEN